MNQLVVNQNGSPVTSSRMVAEKFNKRHDNVIRSIKKIDCSDKFRALNFEESTYLQNSSVGAPKEQTEYIITKDGFTFLVMGFTGKEAAKFKEQYIEAFNQMEAELKQQQNQLPAKTTEILLQLTNVVSRLSDKVSQLENTQDRPEQVSIPVYEDYATVTQFVEEIEFPITTGEITKISNAAVLVCRKTGMKIKTWEDDVFGKTYKYYPKSVLHKAVSTVFSF
jgi:Rha family phage regulatory protein